MPNETYLSLPASFPSLSIWFFQSVLERTIIIALQHQSAM